MDIIKLFLKEEDGQGMMEYILIIATVALMIIVAMSNFEDSLTNKYEDVGVEIVKHI